MDTETRKLLEQTFHLVEENNKMLHKVRGVQKWSFFWQALKWTVIIGIALGSFYYLEPYLNSLISVYGSISDTSDQLNSVGSVSDLLKNIGN